MRTNDRELTFHVFCKKDRGTDQCNWMATFIDYILIPLNLKTRLSVHINIVIGWPSNCTGFHGHHKITNPSIKPVRVKFAFDSQN